MVKRKTPSKTLDEKKKSQNGYNKIEHTSKGLQHQTVQLRPYIFDLCLN